MAVEKNDSANEQINTTQPRVLRGLQLSGVKASPTVTCEGPEGGRQMVVNVEDYDKSLHGPKIAAEKLPARSSSKKKASKKKAKDKEE